MKLLFTVNSYEPLHDGVQFVTKYLAEGLVSKGHSVDLITCYHPEATNRREEDINGVHVIRWDARTHHTKHIGNRNGYIKYVLNNLNTYDCMINVGTQTPFLDWLLPIINQVDMPKILYVHSIWDFKYHKENFQSAESIFKKVWNNVRWKLYYKRWGDAFKKYNRVIQLHEKDYSSTFFYDKYGIKSVIVENAADNSFFDDSQDSTISLPRKYIINVSNYDDRKNQMKMLSSFLSANTPSDFEMILIGSTRNSYCEKMIETYQKHLKSNPNGKKIHILYDIPREQISTYVKNASLYIMASKWEAFPISLTESMAAGVPWISTDVGIVKYLPGGVISDEKKDLAYWIGVLTNDRSKAETLGSVGNAFAKEHFRISKKVDQVEKCIFDAINDYKRRKKQ